MRQSQTAIHTTHMKCVHIHFRNSSSTMHLHKAMQVIRCTFMPVWKAIKMWCPHHKWEHIFSPLRSFFPFPLISISSSVLPPLSSVLEIFYLHTKEPLLLLLSLLNTADALFCYQMHLQVTYAAVHTLPTCCPGTAEVSHRLRFLLSGEHAQRACFLQVLVRLTGLWNAQVRIIADQASQAMRSAGKARGFTHLFIFNEAFTNTGTIGDLQSQGYVTCLLAPWV